MCLGNHGSELRRPPSHARYSGSSGQRFSWSPNDDLVRGGAHPRLGRNNRHLTNCSELNRPLAGETRQGFCHTGSSLALSCTCPLKQHVQLLQQQGFIRKWCVKELGYISFGVGGQTHRALEQRRVVELGVLAIVTIPGAATPPWGVGCLTVDRTPGGPRRDINDRFPPQRWLD